MAPARGSAVEHGPARRFARARAAAGRALVAFLFASPTAGAAASPPVVDSALVLGQANGGGAFASPMGIALDAARGEVVVANTGRHRVEFFDLRTWPRGSFVHRVPDGAGGMRDGLPSHVAVDGSGALLVVDRLAPFVDVLDFRGQPAGRLLLPPPDDDLAGGGGPGALAVAPDGSVLVASRGEQGRIHVFGPDHRWIRSWGEPGREPGRLAEITALAVTPEGEVVVVSASTELAVQVFTARGAYLRGFGVHDIGPGNFSLPTGVAVTQDGRIWVCDAIRQLVQVFDAAGTFLGTLGGNGTRPGEFNYPSALASDGRAMLALAERAGNRFQLMWVR